MRDLSKTIEESGTEKSIDTREKKLMVAYGQLSDESKTTIDILVERLLKYETQEGGER